MVTAMSARECGSELPQPFQTNESDVGRSQGAVHKPGRELSVTAAHAVLIPRKQLFHLDVSDKFGVALVQRGPTPVSCPQVHVKQLTEIMAETGEEAQVLQWPRVGRDLDSGRVWTKITVAISARSTFSTRIRSLFRLICRKGRRRSRPYRVRTKPKSTHL